MSEGRDTGKCIGMVRVSDNEGVRDMETGG